MDNENTNVQEKFLSELKELLSRYDASINFEVGAGSYTHSWRDSHMEIRVGGELVLRVNGWGFAKEDI